MIKTVVSGYGKMGCLVEQKLNITEGMECIGIFDPLSTDPEVAAHPKDLSPMDVIIDFSHPDNIFTLGEYAKEHGVALVIATTGHTGEQKSYIEKLSAHVSVVYTANCSLGVTVLAKVLRDISSVLSDSFDIEIIEKHHNLKLDSPSGTAKMLAEAVDPEGQFEKTYGRHGDGRRGREVGIHAVRGGNIVGEHTVIFAGEDEVLEFTHKAGSKQIFVNGAVRAAQFAVKHRSGLYDMNDVLFKRIL
jgi:4-hydroxy-tetrahydrodipicolinate reductase